MKKKLNRYKEITTIVRSKVFLVLGTFFVLVLGYALGKGFVQRNQVSSEIEMLKQEIASLERDEGDLKKLLAYIESEDFLRQEGKIKFGLKEEGEHAVIVKDMVTQQRPMLEVVEAENVVELSNPQKWLHFFFK